MIEHLPDPLGELRAIRPAAQAGRAAAAIDAEHRRVCSRACRTRWRTGSTTGRIPSRRTTSYQFSDRTLAEMTERAGYEVARIDQTRIQLGYSFGGPRELASEPQAAGLCRAVRARSRRSPRGCGMGDWLYLAARRPRLTGLLPALARAPAKPRKTCGRDDHAHALQLRPDGQFAEADAHAVREVRVRARVRACIGSIRASSSITRDWFKAINPRGQVPALEDDGRIVTESTVICEYLEDAHPTDGQAAARRSLRPRADAGLDQVGRRILLLVRLDDRLAPRGQPHGQGAERRGVRGAPQEHPDPRAAGEVAPRARGLPAGPARRGNAQDRASRCASSTITWPTTSGSRAASIRWPTSATSPSPTGWRWASPSWSTREDTPHLVRWIEQINARPQVQEMFAKVPRERLGPAEGLTISSATKLASNLIAR